MSGLVPMKKLEIVIEKLKLGEVLEIIDRAGAEGYTVLPAVQTMGRRHGIRKDEGLSDFERTKVVLVVASAPVIASIIERMTPILAEFPGTLWVSDVEMQQLS